MSSLADYVKRRDKHRAAVKRWKDANPERVKLYAKRHTLKLKLQQIAYEKQEVPEQQEQLSLAAVAEEKECVDASKVQVGGDHYRTFVIQPSEFIHKNSLGFLEGNVIKYVCRHGVKHGRIDLEKARHYIDLLIEWEYNNGKSADTGYRDYSIPTPDNG